MDYICADQMQCILPMNNIEGHYQVLIQAVIQLVCWRYILNYVRQYASEHCTNKSWFRNWSSKPDGFKEETGDDNVIMTLCAIVQHCFGGIFVGLGYFLESPQLFVIGALSEFAFEALDMVRAIRDHLDGKKVFPLWLMMIHHQGAFTAILPACLFYAENEQIRQIAWGLLGFSPIGVTLHAFTSSRDIYNLQERGQFTVCYMLNIVSSLYFRWYVTVSGMYTFLMSDEFGGLSFGLQAMLMGYCILIKLFDGIFFPVMWRGLYEWLFTPKCMERPTKITKASLMRPCAMPVGLIRMQSTPLM